VLYGRETSSLTLTEQQKLRAFKKRELRKIFGLKRKEMTGDYRRLQNEQLAVLYSCPDINLAIKSGRIKMEEHVAHMGEEWCTQSFGGETCGKSALRRPRSRRKDNKISF
jgi:hypothetical protein